MSWMPNVVYARQKKMWLTEPFDGLFAFLIHMAPKFQFYFWQSLLLYRSVSRQCFSSESAHWECPAHLLAHNWSNFRRLMVNANEGMFVHRNHQSSTTAHTKFKYSESGIWLQMFNTPELHFHIAKQSKIVLCNSHSKRITLKNRFCLIRKCDNKL